MGLFDDSLGAILIGILIATALYGVATAQFYHYIQSSGRDSLFLRGTVWSVWVLETVHTICLWIYLYRITVTFYGQPAVLIETYWALNLGAFFDGVVGAIVQSFFAWRVRVVSQTWYIPVLAWTGALVQFAVTIAITAIASSVSLIQFNAKYPWLPELALGLDVAVDVLNTGALCYYLLQQRQGFSTTNKILDKLILWTIETGLITALTAISMLILVKALPAKITWVALSFFYAKLYSNSLLASLNGRATLRRAAGTVVDGSSSNALSGSHAYPSRGVGTGVGAGSVAHTQSKARNPMQVSVFQERTVDLEMDGFAHVKHGDEQYKTAF